MLPNGCWAHRPTSGDYVKALSRLLRKVISAQGDVEEVENKKDSIQMLQTLLDNPKAMIVPENT